jgi:hypothetical protein
VTIFYDFYDGLNDTQKSIFVDESLSLLNCIKHAVAKLVDYATICVPLPSG